MDLKSNVQFEIKKGDKTYQFFAPVGAPLGECYDAAQEVLAGITEQVVKATDAAKRKDEVPAEETPVESIKAEVVGKA